MSWTKGYDSEEIHELIHDTLNSVPSFLSETENGNGSRDITENGSLACSMMNNITKKQGRNGFSVMKRKFGEILKARKYRSQIKEIKIKVILYNISRMISTLSFLILIEDFYKADIFSIYFIYQHLY